MGQVAQETEQGIVKDVFGTHVNRAARIEALGVGGHVLTSYTVWDNAKGWLKQLEHIQWKEHGRYLLKGLSDPVEVFEPYDRERIEPLQALSQRPIEHIQDKRDSQQKKGFSPTETHLKIFEKTPDGPQLKLTSNSPYVTIGRSSKSDIQLEDTTVSWEHGSILFRKHEYMYHHVSETNPTYIKRHHEEILLRKDVQTELPLKHNDRIVIGGNILIVQFNVYADEAPPPTTMKEDAE